MKQTLSFHSPIIASTQSKVDVEAFEKSTDAFEKGERLQSFYLLLDYIDPELRSKFGNAEGTEFAVPHGSIMVYLRLEGDQLNITAPFLLLPEKGRIPLLRQVAALNLTELTLACISLQNDKLFFDFHCPVALCNPYKIYYVLEEICRIGDKYDDEFVTKFKAERIYEPKITPYDDETVDNVYKALQQTCQECMDAVKYFETERKYGYAWNILSSTLLKICYFVCPQGQLLNDLDKAITDHGREDMPLPEIVSRTKSVVTRLQEMTKEQLAADLYFVETFISDRRRSVLKNIQDNFEDTYEKAGSALESGDFIVCCLLIINKFYELYYYNNVQNDVNAVVAKAMKATSAMSWEEAAPILYEAMDNIMEGELDVDDDEEGGDEDGETMGFDMSQLQQMQQEMMQQAMQNIDMEQIQKMQQLAMENMQKMMAGTYGNNNNTEEDTNK